MVAYVLAWLLLPRRFLRERMTTKDVFLLNAIKTIIPTNWVMVLKDHMIDVRVNHAHNLPYGVFIELSKWAGSKFFGSLINESGWVGSLSDQPMIGRAGLPVLTALGIHQQGSDEQTVVTSLASPPISDEDHFAFIPQTDFEKYVAEQYRKTSKRILRVEKTLFKLENKVDVLNKKGINSDFTIEDSNDSDDESTDEDSMEMFGLE
ncbi:hypothetical protein V8G54_012069 [Vigna mungo]|uniref:Uncharacterized protein n=1 Tax=Vigna mungo TaxID=3915 RepID=A0AAQ3NS94_VIGMU